MSPLARSAWKLQNIFEGLYIIENNSGYEHVSDKCEDLTNSARSHRHFGKSDTKVGNLRALAQSCRASKMPVSETGNSVELSKNLLGPEGFTDGDKGLEERNEDLEGLEDDGAGLEGLK